jgi:hypothetical protein
MSPLFSEMIMATATRDLVQKKMCYLYLSNYASRQPEMALLVINTLQKDARDEDPMVRGLALRCLCSLHVENVLEYLVEPVMKGLQDVSPYGEWGDLIMAARADFLWFGCLRFMYSLRLERSQSGSSQDCNHVRAASARAFGGHRGREEPGARTLPSPQ